MSIIQKARSRFLLNIDTSDKDGCHIWMLGLSSRGYGNFSINDKTYSAHRLSYTYYKGEIPKGMHVLHKCDNRKCVNPGHLFLGTHRDNMRDMCGKGRGALCRGNNPNAKLTHEDVSNLLSAYRSKKATQVQLADQFKISQAAVSEIIRKSDPKLKVSF